ncbi:MAG: GAF domain-containing protein [Oscillospiraceae bacterium]|nr:GAF domain-containing protein [Oscillospiraceae bacterium]
MTEIDTNRLLEVGIALTREKDIDILLETILTAAMDFTDCDGGTLYTKGEDSLTFRTMITRSQNVFKNGKNEPITLPPVPLSRGNVCAFAAIENKIVNISDVYNSTEWDFAGPRNYDAMTGYKTTSMLVIPMQNNRDEVIGVLQLINAQDENGKVTPFDSGYERVILSLSSQAAMQFTNINYAAEIEALLDSFVRVMSSAIDERSHYTANHSKNMTTYAKRFIAWLQRTGNEWQFSDIEKRQFLMSVQLHDVGKLVIPLEVMDKESRLGGLLPEIEHRFSVLLLQNKIDLLDGRITVEVFDEKTRQINDALQLIHKANNASFLQDETIEKIRSLADPAASLLQPHEAVLLSIRKGTLSDEERRTIESHVVITAKLLDEINFPKDYENVKNWASQHHEHLNGKGYPNHLSGEEIPRETRLLTIIDVFDSLTAQDRPYKPAMPVEKTLGILETMVKDGQIDGEILSLFIESAPWKD